MSQEDVANKLRTTPEYIARIEQGDVDPVFSYLVKLAEALDADLQIVFLPREEHEAQGMPERDNPQPQPRSNRGQKPQQA